MRIVPLALITAIVLFFTGLIAPRKSRRLERWIRERLEKGERQGKRRAGWLGDATAKLLAWGQSLTKAAAFAGRSLHNRIAGDG